MTEELKAAINLIEEAGGFVMMQTSIDEEIPLTEAQMDAIEEEQNQAFDDYQERRREAYKRFDKLLGSENFSYNRVEEICFEEGIDMDDIENYIHEHY